MIDNLPTNFWDDLNAEYSLPRNLLVDELGDIGTWFGLDWLRDTNFSLRGSIYINMSK